MVVVSDVAGACLEKDAGSHGTTEPQGCVGTPMPVRSPRVPRPGCCRGPENEGGSLGKQVGTQHPAGASPLSPPPSVPVLSLMQQQQDQIQEWLTFGLSARWPEGSLDNDHHDGYGIEELSDTI